MKRRKFLIDALTVSAGAVVGGRAFATPCPPQFSSNSLVACSGTALSIASQGLASGQSVEFTKNVTQRPNDIQWMTKALHYDPFNREIQYIGKPASSQSTDWAHYLYDEGADSWTNKGVITSGQGHSWLNTMDPTTGDLYWNNGLGSGTVRKYVRSSDRWQSFSLPTSNNNIGTIAYHPNLFGNNEPGIYIWTGRFHLCYNISDGSIANVGPTTGSGADTGTTGNIKNGTGDYCPSRNSLVCGGKGQMTGSSRRPVIEVHAGAGNSSDAEAERSIVYHGEAPAVIYGAGADGRHAKLVAHPSDPGQILLLEGYGTDRVWASTNGGGSWSLKGFTHPFGNMGGWVNHWTIGRISEYGVILAMSSDGNGGRSILWSPPV